MELLSRLKGRATNLYCSRGRHDDISVGAISRLRDGVYTNFNSIALYISSHAVLPALVWVENIVQYTN